MKISLTGKNTPVKKCIFFPVTDLNSFKIKMLNWVNRFSIFCFLDNREYDFEKPAFECLLAAGCKKEVRADAGDAFRRLRSFYDDAEGEWLFGHFGYDLKNETEVLRSGHTERTGFSDLYFFVPEWVIRLDTGGVIIYGEDDIESVYREICASSGNVRQEKVHADLRCRISKADYLNTVSELQQHILRGDCYEINFCQEFFVDNILIDPLSTYVRLSDLSPNPYSSYYRVNDQYCLCASPERYLKKTGSRLISQPIKGTSGRRFDDAAADLAAKNYLLQTEKEKSENVMVVDLVRNDLSRVCIPGTVKVDELFGLYSFPQVHQMISTVSGEIDIKNDWIDCVKATFPMGSMTGAPKMKVMELIEQYETTRRGLFSGAIGYLNPEGDFDFNVVIRSIFYNAADRYLSFQTGGGITYYSDPEQEYAESMLKAKAMRKVLE